MAIKHVNDFCAPYVHMETIFVVLYIEHDAAFISFNITVGYKDTSRMKKGKWSILAKGHVSRMMTCQYNEWVSIYLVVCDI